VLGHQKYTSVARVQGFDALLALVLDEGTATHRHRDSDAMARGPEAARNVADAVHHLCLLHGRFPGVIDHAALRASGTESHPFLTVLADSFDGERSLLTKLVVAVGPLPSTPGQASSEAAMLAQHHAIDMLAQSDRNGCALGAALAVAIDWLAVRPMLDKAALRLGFDANACTLPGIDFLQTTVSSFVTTPAIERAMMFGAQQIVAQHRGLWDLLEARAIAREHAQH